MEKQAALGLEVKNGLNLVETVKLVTINMQNLGRWLHLTGSITPSLRNLITSQFLSTHVFFSSKKEGRKKVFFVLYLIFFFF